MKRRPRAMGANNSSSSSVRQSGEPTFFLPPDVLEEIFLNLPPHLVVCVCRLVCHQWKEVADRESFWRERCRREGYHIHDASKVPSDWRLFYFLCKKRRNLLKNPRGEDKFQDWTLVQNGGDRWKIEEPMVPHPNEAVQKNFVTSYRNHGVWLQASSGRDLWDSDGTVLCLHGSTVEQSFNNTRMCIKSQTIDLGKEGYRPSFMDEFQPPIRISDWYAPRWDCGSEYTITVQLLDCKNVVLQTFAPDTIYFAQWNDQQWHQMTHVFKDYGPGVRYIKFIHGGKDTQFWAGWYGIRVTDSCVEVCPVLDT